MFKNSLFLALILLSGCNETQTKVSYDGAKLLEQKCASCHNIDLPPKTYQNEKAPPMMAVAFHVANFVKPSDESQRVSKAVEFVKDYVINPSREKAFCDKESLESYGVMPSQKGNVNEDELDAIAKYMFSHFTQKNLTEAQEAINRLQAMPKGQRLALQNNCLGCHRVDKDLVGPSFIHIKERYASSPQTIQKSIKNGSVNRWKSSKGAHMPSFQKLSDNDVKTLSEWILNLGEKK